MPINELHRKVAAVALRAASGHGFALGGGNAVIAHGDIDRVTEDIDSLGLSAREMRRCGSGSWPGPGAEWP
jgi:hypothetical protein